MGESAYTGTAPTRKQWPQAGHSVPTEYTRHSAPQQDSTVKLTSGNNNKKVLVVSDNKVIDYTQSSPHLYESPQAENAIDAFYG